MGILAFIAILVAGLFLIVLFDKKMKGYLETVQTTHVSGIKGLQDGMRVNLYLYPDRVTINDKQILPLSRIKFAHVATSEQLKEKQKSVIKRAVAGGLLLGPLGAVVGGISGIGTKTKQIEVLFMTLDYTTKDGIEESAVFVSEGKIMIHALKGFAGAVNKQLGYDNDPIQDQQTYEI